MHPNVQVFFNNRPTLRTLLRSPPRIDHAKELIPLPAHIFNDSSECSKTCVQHLLAKHPFCHSRIVEVFHKNHIASVAKSVSLLKVKILAGVVNLMVQQGNFNSGFLVVLRPLSFPLESTLQQFQLALQTLQELRRFYEYAITGCQEFLKPDIDSDCMTLWTRLGNANIALQSNRGVPSIGIFIRLGVCSS
jgi:hypothetical protein